MPGTKEGGKKTAITNKRKYGEDYYAKIGSIGGKLGSDGGFAKKKPCRCSVFRRKHTVPMCAGYKGGKVSRKGVSNATL